VEKKQMFKIGVIGDEVSQDFQTVVDFATAFKLDSIEIRSVWEKPPQMLVGSDIGEMKRILKRTNLQIAGIASPFFKCDIDNVNERREHLNILRQCIKLAEVFGTNLIRTFAFWKTDNTEERWAEIVSAYDEPVRIAERAGVILGMENEHSTSLATAQLTERFVREINSPNVRAIWDPANEAHVDEDGEKPYPDAYNRLKLLMVHAHLKDAGKNPATGKIECVPVGEGVIDWQGQLQAFVDDGYEGHLCLETHWRSILKIDDDQLQRPGGTIFSQAGEEASRLCIQNLFAMLNRMQK
jgi:sugar phosphate isomerase/epimerase